MTAKAPDFFDKPENIKLILRVFYGICASLVIAELFAHHHILHAWENLPAFHAIFGFVVCLALVLIAKLLREVIMRKEDYYDAE